MGLFHVQAQEGLLCSCHIKRCVSIVRGHTVETGSRVEVGRTRKGRKGKGGHVPTKCLKGCMLMTDVVLRCLTTLTALRMQSVWNTPGPQLCF